MKIHCLAVDDEKPALQIMENYIRKTPFLELRGGFHDPIMALEKVKQQGIELLFLDINMPDLNGMELARLIPSNTKVIFTTAYQRYAVESYKIDAMDYLLKPISYEEFLSAANKAQAYFELLHSANDVQDSPTYIFVKADYRWHKISFEEILFIQNIKDYVQIHLTSGKKLMVLMSLKLLIEKLPQKGFMKVHRSFVVNLSKVETIEGSQILFGKKYIPISKAHRDEFQRFLLGG